MQLIKLDLNNFRCFDTFSCDFSPGLNLLVGPNGSGKTTILEALNMMLYAKQLSSSRASFIRPSSDSAELSLLFSHDGVEYVINKKLKQSTVCSLRNVKTGEQLARNTTETHNFLLDLLSTLEFDPRLWYLRQGAVHEFLNLFSTINTKLFSLFGFYDFENFKKRFLQSLGELFPLDENDYNEIKVLLRQTINELSGLPEVDDKTIKLARKEVERVSKKLDLLSKLEAHKQRQDDIIKLQQELNTLSEEFSILEEKDKKLSNAIDNIRKQVSHLCASQTLLSVSSLPIENRKVFEEFFNDLKNKITSAEHSLQRYEELNKEARSLFYSRPRSSLRNIDTLNQSIIEDSNQLNRYLKIKEALDHNAEGECPVCLRPIDVSFYSVITNRISNLKKKLEYSKLFLSKYVNNQERRKKIKNKIKASKELSTAIKKELAALPFPISRKEEFYIFTDDVWELLTNLDSLLIEQTVINKKLETLKLRISFVKEQLSNYLQNAASDVPFVTENLNEVKDKLYSEIKKLHTYEENKKHREKLLRTAEKFNKKYASLDSLAKFRAFSRNFIDSFHSSLLSSIKEYISVYFLSQINETLTTLENPYTLSVEYDEEGNVNFLANFVSYGLPISYLSFGQRVLLSILFAIVFHLHNNSFGILLIDEPTAGLDADNISRLIKLLEMLNALCIDHNLQCILATHEYEYFPKHISVIRLNGK